MNNFWVPLQDFSLSNDQIQHAMFSLGLVAAIVATKRFLPIYILLAWPATIVHELSHFIVGVLLQARPVGFSVIPKRSATGWTLGEVRFSDLGPFNTIPVAMAPLLIMLPVAVWMSTALPCPFLPGHALGVAELLLGCWPSPQDWRLAGRSLFVLAFIGVLSYLLVHIFFGHSN